MSKKIYVNCRYLTQHTTGVQRYAEEICKKLSEIDENLIFVAPPKKYMLKNHTSIKIVNFGFFNGHIWEQFVLPFYFIKKRNYILLNLANTAPIFGTKNALVLHDIQFARKPRIHSFLFTAIYKAIIPLALKRSSPIITVSHESKKDILKFYKTKKEIIIAPNATSETFSSNAITETFKKKYILSISPFSYHKNFSNIIKSFLSLEDKSYQLIITGTPNKNFNFSKDDIELKNVKFIGRVTDTELKNLYQHAKCLIYPSFSEGFGLPIIEAQKCQCPVIASDIPVFHEVGGESILYCNPFDYRDIANKIELLIRDVSLCEELKNRGLINSEKYSWQRSAEKIYNAIQKQVI
ncbi:hypothetical protein TH25_01600 [Thalassospira profundimaris]|uniref:Glycosyl transferase family 1 domain-containing protein n=1 Tax=Thalassospira profundimaris TaxID=502049 RepID=A0A367XK76_9PROT|nr:glycosyltransferase family 1 protein [Thalassospira profundimaris]RCK54064.1 hypothetical protein TH25_01600 [Thalassospira profundimaris]